MKNADDFEILHNPRCSKSRQTLALLREHGISPRIRLYLENALSASELANLCAQLGTDSANLIRAKEAKAAGLEAKLDTLSDDEICQFLANNPACLERPIVVRGARAVIGRPPENVLSLISGA